MKRIDTLKTREDFIRAAEAECGHGSEEVNCIRGCVFRHMSSEGGSYCQDIWECMADWLYAEVTEVKR